MSHQDRRDPLPVDYQYPTHGVDCDCPPCRNKHTHAFRYDISRDTFVCGCGETISAAEVWSSPRVMLPMERTQTAYGWGV